MPTEQVEILNADELVKVKVFRDVEGKMVLQVLIEGACRLRMHAHAAMQFTSKLLAGAMACKHEVEGDEVLADAAALDAIMELAVAHTVNAQLEALKQQVKKPTEPPTVPPV